jgi:hypothetical protein
MLLNNNLLFTNEATIRKCIPAHDLGDSGFVYH